MISALMDSLAVEGAYPSHHVYSRPSDGQACSCGSVDRMDTEASENPYCGLTVAWKACLLLVETVGGHYSTPARGCTGLVI